MPNKNNGALRAVLITDRVLRRDLIALQFQIKLFEHALAEHYDAVEALVQRQVNEIPLSDEPDYRRNLIHDIFAVHMALQGVTVHGRELLAAIERVAPVTSAATPNS